MMLDGSGGVGGELARVESLDAKGRRIALALRTGIMAVYPIAHEIMELVDTWDVWGPQANGLSVDAWCKLVTGRHVRVFEAIEQAVGVLGEHIRRWMHPDVAVWLSGVRVPPDRRAEMLKTARRFQESAGYVSGDTTIAVPLDLVEMKQKLRGVFKELRPRRRGTHPCQMCDKLRYDVGVLVHVLENHGIEVPKLRSRDGT